MKRVAALLFALCAVSLARADIGPPQGKKTILYTLRPGSYTMVFPETR